MPEITLFGWFHTAIAIVALFAGVCSFVNHKVIRLSTKSGSIYVGCTVIAAATALGIYKHGGFGPAHALAVMTLLALVVGALAEKRRLFGTFSKYIQAAAYSATFLFHMIPAITDGLMRLPVDAPIVTAIDDPLLRGFHMGFFLTYLVGLALQIRWLRKTTQA